MSSKKFNFIDLIDGEKGGVGKSFFCKVYLQYLIDNDRSFVAFETDKSNPDVKNIYPDHCKFAYFSENEKKAGVADRIFESGISSNVLVNLPSQVKSAFQTWFIVNNLYALGQEHHIAFRKWFVSSGEYDSIHLFLESLELYGEQIEHILVRNFGLCEEWEQVEQDKSLKAAIQKYSVKVINLPKLVYSERWFINKHQLSFSAARNHDKLGIMGKQRIVKFLELAYAEIDNSGAWQGQDSNTKVGASSGAA